MKLILFDCDGTLVDSQNHIVEAVTTAFTHFNILIPSRKEILSVVGLSLPEAVAELLKEADQTQIHAIAEVFKTAYMDQRTRTGYIEPLYEGAKEAILELAVCDDVFLGVATGKSRRGVDKLFDMHDLHAHFVTIQTADNAPSKPHPAMIEQAVRETGVDLANVVMIGDTSFDMKMARHANVTALGVSWGYHDISELHKAGAHEIVHDFVELSSSVRKILNLRSKND